jgi:hypothetical protein
MRTKYTLLAAALLLCGVVSARAGTLDIVITNTTTEPGTAGQFEIDLVNNSASAVTVASFSVDALLSSPTNVQFTAVDNATTAPYIFSITGSFGTGFSGTLLPDEVMGNDTAASGGQVVNIGETWGLAHVRYVVVPNAPLGTVVPVMLQAFPATSLSDPSGANIPFTGVDGTITIGTPMVPEPASFTMLAMAGVAVLAVRRWKTFRS